MTRRHPLPALTGLAGMTLLALALTGCADSAGTTSAATADATSPPAATDAPASQPAAGGACMPTDGPGTIEITMAGRAFSTSQVAASVGEVIGFTNQDSVPHTATLDEGTCTTENLGKGASGSLVFDAPGSYPFHCRIHPDMTGTFVIS
jgi:plastocyanin